ncbi:hypothetical protein GGR52DRAFT_179375 [Hypoxylon sp. FL1284]|nr:hypothetical protein GGR52DRAFT_179375 [Hypoxylon sp. FL1284]
MSFGLGVGDIITVIRLTDKACKEFANAPGHFEIISDEVENLSIILRKVEKTCSSHGLNDTQKKELQHILDSCRAVLDDIEKVIVHHSNLNTKPRGVVPKGKKVWERLTWRLGDMRDFRSRINLNVTLLIAFNQQIYADGVVQLRRGQLRQDDRDILDWLTPLDYGQQSDYISRRQPGTGR